MHRRITTLGLPAVALAAIASCTAAPSRPESAPNATPPASQGPSASCPRSGARVTAGPPDAALGLRALGVTLTNCGTRPYTVDGYPGVRLLDADHRPLDVRVGQGSSGITAPDAYDAPPRPITLQPGETAITRLVWRNTVTDSTVTATTGTYLEITPAGGEQPQTVTPSGGVDLGNTGQLGVSAWIAPPPA